MKHVRMIYRGRGPLHTYYYLKWMYDQMRHGDYGISYGMWYDIANAYVQCWARERSSGRKRKEYIKKIIHVWVEGNIRWGIEFKSTHEWYRGCKPCDKPNGRIVYTIFMGDTYIDMNVIESNSFSAFTKRSDWKN